MSSPASVWTTWKPPGAPFPFATAVHDDTWCLITEAGIVAETGEFPDSVREQTRLAVINIERRLAAAGMTLDEVVHVRSYVTAREHAEEMDAVMAEAFNEPMPASGALVICELFDPRMKVEFEVVARRGASRR